MSVIVTDAGFGPDSFNAGFAPLGEARAEQGIDLPNTADVVAIWDSVKAAPAIRIPFPSSADGRGYSIASRLRDLGYTGRLRAEGHVIADQYRKARGSGRRIGDEGINLFGCAQHADIMHRHFLNIDTPPLCDQCVVHWRDITFTHLFITACTKVPLIEIGVAPSTVEPVKADRRMI